ncbi:hypothetical protein [Corynebacterium vitaeruminis]|uniref:Transcription activator, effector binding protein n=1 Tax=Corynebacterium vitaeruminis DSM 20294 TaxID=1224164 RepID=W5XXM0_9CORY|nr:hypothetical protein [Corynebacterium vitaeruminis]AHI21419.1 transcription activator, effector binding protein [Corynebacterium vitaeruminis DSM 20294]
MEISEPFVFPAHVAIAIREDVPIVEVGDFFSRSYELLGEVLGRAQAVPVAVRGYYFSAPSATLDVTAAFVIDPAARTRVAELVPEYSSRGVEILEFAETRAIKTELTGGYEQLGGAWGEFCTLIARAGYEAGEWTCEDYLTMPSEVPVDEVRTDLYSAII